MDQMIANLIYCTSILIRETQAFIRTSVFAILIYLKCLEDNIFLRRHSCYRLQAVDVFPNDRKKSGLSKTSKFHGYLSILSFSYDFNFPLISTNKHKTV